MGITKGPELLKVWDNFEAGIGFPVEDGTPGMYTASKILGLRGELRPAPAATQVTIDADPGHHFQYFFEEPVTAGQVPVFDSGSNGTASNATTVATSNHTIANQDNRLLLVAIADTGDAILSSIVWNGSEQLTKFYSRPVGTASKIFFAYLLNPTVTTSTIVCTWTGTQTTMVVIAGSWYKVDQNSPFGDRVFALDVNDAGPITDNVTSNSSEVVVDASACTDTVQTMTVGAGQTEVSGTGGVTVGDLRLGSSYETGAATTTMSWTLGAASDWTILAVPLVGAKPGPSYLYAQRGKKGGSSSTAKVNKTSLANIDFGATSTSSYHDLTPLTVCGQPVRYQGYWWFPMGDNQKARRLQTVGTNVVDSTAVIDEGATFSATDTTLTVDDGTQFTDDDYIKIEGEILKITNIATHNLTVVRAQYGTTAATHADATVIYLISVANDTLDATANALGADHFANLGFQVISTLAHSANDDGGVRILKKDGDVGTEAHWGSPFQVGDRNERAGGVSGLSGMAFTLNVEGLYSFNQTGRSGLVFEDFRMWRHVFDNMPIQPYRGGLIISHPTGLIYYIPGQPPTNIGLDANKLAATVTPPGPTDLFGGRYHGTAVAGDIIYTIYQPDLSSTTALVLVGYPGGRGFLWQGLGTTTLADTDHMLGCFVSVSSKPTSAEYVTPTLWYGNGDDLDYKVLSTNGSPFRPRADTHVVETSGDVYLPELTFPTPHRLSHFAVYTEDMAGGDEWQLSGISNAGSDQRAGAPVLANERAERFIEATNVRRFMPHINWTATSSSARVPPTIKRIELYGWAE